MTNLPTLYRNIMDGLGSDFACDAFLWCSDKTTNDPYLYKAEAFSREAEMLRDRLEPMVVASFRIYADHPPSIHAHPDTQRDLMAFLLTRHANLRLGGNLRPTYAEGV